MNPGIHHWESSDLSTAPQRLKKNVYLCIYISYFCTCLVLGRWNLTPMQVRIPLSPHTTLNTIQLLQLLCLLTTPLGVANQQICKLQTASSDLSIYRHVSLIGQCSLWSSLETIVLLVVSHSCACARKLITTIFLHIEYSTTLYFTAKPLWHL